MATTTNKLSIPTTAGVKPAGVTGNGWVSTGSGRVSTSGSSDTKGTSLSSSTSTDKKGYSLSGSTASTGTKSSIYGTTNLPTNLGTNNTTSPTARGIADSVDIDALKSALQNQKAALSAKATVDDFNAGTNGASVNQMALNNTLKLAGYTPDPNYTDPTTTDLSSGSGGSGGSGSSGSSGSGSSYANALANYLANANTSTPLAAPDYVGTGTNGDDVDALKAQLQAEQQRRAEEGSGKINDLYDKQLANTRASLESAYNANLGTAQAALEDISPTYQSAANDLAIQYERNKRGLNAMALANGVGSGTGTQQQLGLNQQYLTAHGNLRGQEAAARVKAQQEINKIKMQYQNDISSAIAQNDYQRAAALLDEYNNQQSWYDTQLRQTATDLSKYGNMSGYGALYGNDQASYMQRIWALQNPGVAYANGMITADDYRRVTGEEAPGTETSNAASLQQLLAAMMGG